MKTFERLNKNEMKMIVGGVDTLEGGGDGSCVSCDCSGGNSSCWYSKRTVSELCTAVCGSNVGWNGLSGVGCGG